MCSQTEVRGPVRAVRSMRRYYPGYLRGISGNAPVRRELNTTDPLDEVLALFDRLEARVAASGEILAA